MSSTDPVTSAHSKSPTGDAQKPRRTRWIFLAALSLFGWTLSAEATKVGVYYFGVWSRPSCTVCRDGNEDWWRGVREYAAGDVDPSLPWANENFDHLEPAIGFYDGANPNVLARQIRQARANGLSFFVFNWYWSHEVNGGQGGEKFGAGLDAFLATPATYDLEFAVSVTAHPWSDLQIPAAQLDRAADKLVQRYFGQPHYLRTSTGRPILFLTDTRGLNGGSHAQVAHALARIRQKTIARWGVSPFFVLASEHDDHEGGISGQRPFLDLASLPQLDAVSCYNEFFHSLEDRKNGILGSLARYNTSLLANLERWRDLVPAVIPCYMLDFDEKPREMTGTPVSHVRYLEDWSLGLMRDGLESIEQFSNATTNGEVDGLVVLYAWNEWREAGHSIEPNAATGNQLLNEVSATFGLDTFGADPCRVRGDCPESLADPVGSIDRADCERFAGWARDPDTSYPTSIQLRLEGQTSPVATIEASRRRGDLPSRGKFHGFAFETPSALRTGQAVTVHLEAIDLSLDAQPRAGRSELTGSPVTLTCAASGTGGGGGGTGGTGVSVAEGSFDRADCEVLAGWARDPDHPAPLQIEVYRGGPRGTGQRIATIVADRRRNDLPYGDKNHGFRIADPTGLGTGQATVHVHARDIDGSGQPTGGWPQLAGSPRTVQCGASTVASTTPGGEELTPDGP